jgi:dihydropteroate synthase
MIETIYFRYLSKEAFLLFFQIFLAFILDAGPFLKNTIGSANITRLQDLVALMESILQWAGLKVLSEKIAEADRLRDHAVVMLAVPVKSAVNFSTDPAIAESARRVEAVLQHYNKAAKKSYDTETVAIALILANLNGPYAADVTALGIGGQKAALQAAHDNFIALINEREEAKKQKPKENLRAVQKEAMALYYEMAKKIDAGAELKLSQEFGIFIAKINPEIERFNSEFHPGRTNLKYAQIAPIPAQIRTGYPITPPTQVFVETKDGMKQLERDKDYYVTFKDNIEVGNAKCTVHGKGKYRGSQTITFAIARV